MQDFDASRVYICEGAYGGCMKKRKRKEMEKIENVIFQIRGKKVILDADLAKLYGVSTKRLNEQIKRNIKRFPEDFMFQLTKFEFLRCRFGTSNLRSQNATSKKGGRRYLPYAFIEQGVAMLSSVLNSEKAIQVNIAIMRAFVKLKRLGLTYSALRRKIDSMERDYDKRFHVVFDAIKKLLSPVPAKRKRIIGFRQE